MNLARRIIQIALLVCLGMIAVVAYWILPSRNAEVHLSAKAPTTSQRITLKAPVFYVQSDPRWLNDKVGGTGESIGEVGCTLCCLSMGLAEHGIDLNPTALNNSLKGCQGYTMKGWIKWNSIEEVTNGKVKVRIPARANYTDIDSALQNGNPCMVKILLGSGEQHWVLIVGRDQFDYLVKDPMGNGRTVEPLSSIAREFIAVRIIEKAI